MSLALAREPGPGLALALEAMATRFELLILDDGDPRRLRAVGEEALAEIARLERLWSRFLPTSEIAWINARAGAAPVRVGPETFRLLTHGAALARATGFAFDPTVAPLLRAWGVAGVAPARPPDAAARARALRLVGMWKLELDAAQLTARLPERGMELDLGAIGKGAALDRAVEVLREHAVGRALIHGGTSSVHVLGRSASGAWRIGWAGARKGAPLAIELDELRPALSVSAAHGRRVTAGGQSWGHVLDPRTGEPVPARSAVVSGPDATTCDALSTALLVHGPSGLVTLGRRFPRYEMRIGA